MAARKLQLQLFVISVLATMILVYLNLNLPKRHKDNGRDMTGSRGWMIRKEQVYAARRRKIKQVCLKYARDEIWRGKSHGSQFWYDIQHGLAVCMHPKVNLSPIAYLLHGNCVKTFILRLAQQAGKELFFFFPICLLIRNKSWPNLMHNYTIG